MARTEAFLRWMCGGTNWYLFFFVMDAYKSSDYSLSKRYSFVITPLLDKCVIYEEPRGVDFPGLSVISWIHTKMLLLSKLYTARIYWLPEYNLIDKRPVKSARHQYFGVKNMRIAPHSCVFVVSWYRNKFLRASLFLIGYSHVYFKISLSWSRFTFSMAMD